jgi:tRNA A-37 threonylcarbamoyl transferase component Bud32
VHRESVARRSAAALAARQGGVRRDLLELVAGANSRAGTGSAVGLRRIRTSRGIEPGSARREVFAAFPEYAARLEQQFDLRRALALHGRETCPEAISALGPREVPVITVAGYEILDELGRGGMAVVYKARQDGHGRVVALKMILSGQLASSLEVERFRIEVNAVADLDHAHIVPIYDVGQDNGRHYFSMKLIEGGSLARQMPKPGTDIRKAVRLLSAVARAVHYPHQRGILHRDLKPANILIDAEGEPHVTNFGLAKRMTGGETVTRSGAIVGMPGYMAPEQARGEGRASTAADIYSPGAILYECLTGRPPFRAETPLETLLQLLEKEPPPPRSLNAAANRDLETVCLKCLEKDTSCRYESAAALAYDLERWLRGEPIQARAVGGTERLWRWCRRNPVAVAVAALLLFLTGIASLSALWLRQERDIARANEARVEHAERDRAERLWQSYLDQVRRTIQRPHWPTLRKFAGSHRGGQDPHRFTAP